MGRGRNNKEMLCSPQESVGETLTHSQIYLLPTEARPLTFQTTHCLDHIQTLFCSKALQGSPPPTGYTPLP